MGKGWRGNQVIGRENRDREEIECVIERGRDESRRTAWRDGSNG